MAERKKISLMPNQNPHLHLTQINFIISLLASHFEHNFLLEKLIHLVFPFHYLFFNYLA